MKRPLHFRIVALSTAAATLLWASGVHSGATQAVQYADTRNLDAFDRVRSSTPTTLFDTQFQYGLQPLLWESVTVGTGTVDHFPNESSVRLRVSASGDKVIRQSHRYFRYQPGKSQAVAMTGILGAIKANTRQRLGYFDDANGIFFEQDGANLRVVQRSSASGAPVDTAINQTSWNLDKFNGTGPSGITIDTSKAQIFWIDLQWLGVGRVRLGFVVNGVLTYCHQFLNANSLVSVYMTTANLPVRYELEQTGFTSGTNLIQICQSVISEGGFEIDRGLPFSAGNGITSISVTTRRPIASIRPKTTFNSITNRGLIIPIEAIAVATSGNALIEVVYNGTLTGASFASVDANSLTESDVAATAISGGIVIASFFASSAPVGAQAQAETSLLDKLQVITLDFSGTVPDRLTIVATAFTGTVAVNGAFNWKEIY
jgi:hypothetical protein